MAETKPASSDGDEFLPLCTPGIAPGKNLDGALGLYDLGAGLLGADLVDETSAKNCLKGTVGNLSLNIDGVQLNLSGGVQYQGIFGPQRRIIASTSSPALCESYYSASDVFSLQLTNANNDAQGASGLLGGVLSTSWTPGTGAMVPNLARAQYAPWIACFDATLANPNIPTVSPDALFTASFETQADLRVQYLDAQGSPIESMVQTIGANSTYKVRISNHGESAAQNVRVREFVPKMGGALSPNMQIFGCVNDADASSCFGPDGTLRQDIASLAPGASVTYTLTRKVNGSSDIAASSGALTSVAAFVDPNAVGERSKFDNTRHLRIGLMTNGAPVATPQTGLVTAEDVPLGIVLAGTDLEGSPLNFVVNQPSANIGQVTGTAPNVTFVPAPDFNGAASFSFTVNDGSVTSAPATVSINVTAVNDAPRVAQQLPNLSEPEGALLEIATAAGFSDPENHTLRYSATGLPPNVNIGPTTGAIVGTLSLSTSGKYTIVVTAKEFGTPDLLSVSQDFILTIGNTNQNPTLDNPIADQDSAEGDVISFSVASNFSDADATDTLTFSLGGGALPPGLSLAANGTISGTISQTASNGSPYSVTVLADDGNDGQVPATFSWTVNTVNVAPITVGTLDDVVGEVGVPMEILGTTIKAAFADPDGNTLTYTAAGLPTGLNFFPASANISGVPAAGTAGSYVVTITARDPGNLTATQAFTISID